ncbi:MAG: hypothetical protein JXR27_13640 [Paludibacteraceae bacterium]|nr:hypothetical protein [Paludibacteraceae bacterium]
MDNKKHILFGEAGKKLPFTVPENYFENFASQMEAQVTIKPVSVFKIMRPWMYMAAMFLGVLFLSRVGYNVYQEKSNTLIADNYELYVLSQVDEAEIIDYYLSDETLK